MRKCILCLTVMSALLASAVPVTAETEVELSGQVRIRDEFDGKSFDSAEAMLNFVDIRTRVNVKATVNENVSALVQFQDSRRMGQFNENGERLSGSLTDGQNVDLHQVYVQVNQFGFDWLSLRAGRFEFVMGNQRVFGAVGWSNIGRAWDGAELKYRTANGYLRLFGLKAAERNNEYYNADFDIFGLNFLCNRLNIDAFVFYEYDADTSGYYRGINRLDRMNMGFNYWRQHERLDFKMNFAYQFGSMAPGLYDPVFPESNTEALDIAAMMFTFEAGLSFGDSPLRRVAAGIDYSSGDDDGTDDTYKAYTNSYYTGHAVRGYMDYFVNTTGTAYADAGLMDMMLRLTLVPADDWKIKVDGHYFKTPADYLDPLTSETTSDVGMELDLTVTTTKIEDVGLALGASFFAADEGFAASADPDLGYWFYGQATVDF